MKTNNLFWLSDLTAPREDLPEILAISPRLVDPSPEELMNPPAEDLVDPPAEEVDLQGFRFAPVPRKRGRPKGNWVAPKEKKN